MISRRQRQRQNRADELPFTGTANFGGQYQHWFHEIGVEMAWKQSLLANANDTVFSLLARYTPLRFIDFTPGVTRGFQLFVLAAIAGRSKRIRLGSAF